MTSQAAWWAVLGLVALAGIAQGKDRSFTISYETDRFLRDGAPVQIVSGTIHYFRVHPADWSDRLRKLRYAGFNAVETYIEWSSHEPEPETYEFSGINNITDFFLKAQQEDLMVVLRPGPFIDAERDMGGLPYWLMRENPAMKLRTKDPSYLTFVDSWFKHLLPIVRPLLYSEGGPVVMVQVENEYGSDSDCDYEYTSHLRDLFRAELGQDVVLFTTDGDGLWYLRCGKIPEVYATVDFGPGGDVDKAFHVQRLFEPHGPLMNTEFYPGWSDYWGKPHSMIDAKTVTDSLDAILARNASVNMYVFNGGTSFGLTSGANLGLTYQACPTSYDYNAPLSEAGDMTEKYFAIRDVVGKYLPLPEMDEPTNSSKFSYGDVAMTDITNLFDLAAVLSSVQSDSPLTFEALSLSNGLVLYETTIELVASDPALLHFESVNDRGYVYLDGQMVGLLAREQKAFELPVFARKGQKLSVVVESQGRICYGPNLNDMKGIIGEVKLGSSVLSNWSNTAFRLTDLGSLQPTLSMLANSISTHTMTDGQMTSYVGTFVVQDEPKDTFLRLDGWTKGIAWINGFNLGRYWPAVGPQMTLYVPHAVLKKGDNFVILLELEGAPCGNTAQGSACSVTFTTEAEVNGPTPQA